MNLSAREWKEFKINNIFETIKDDTQVPTGAYIEKKYLTAGSTPRITVTSSNNGVDDFWDTKHENKREYENFISVNFLGDAFYQPYSATLDMKVHCLKVKNKELDEILALFLCGVLLNNTKNSTYGNQLSSKDIIRKSILLPVDKSGKPDYQFMKDYISAIQKTKLEKYKQYCRMQLHELGEYKSIEPLSIKTCEPFFITDIFDIPKRGKRIIAENYIDGDMPVVSSAGGNNGVIAFAGNQDKVRIYEDCLSVANGGVSAGFAFYHPYPFIATDHVTHFKGKLNRYHYMFLGTIIRNQLHEKYDFNREMTDPRLKREKLLVPVTEEGKLDFDYMEQYIKNLMIKKYESYLDYKK